LLNPNLLKTCSDFFQINLHQIFPIQNHDGYGSEKPDPSFFVSEPGFSLPDKKFRNFRNLPSTGGARYFVGTAQNFRHFETVRAKNWAQMFCEPAKQLEPNKNPFLTHYGAACCILDCALILCNIWHYGGLCNI